MTVIINAILDSNEPNYLRHFRITLFNITNTYMQLQPDTERDSEIENSY